MKESGLTRQERNFVSLMRFLSVVLFFTAGIVALFADWLLNYLTRISTLLLNFPTRAFSWGQDRFWLVPTVALLVVESYLCHLAAQDPLRASDQARGVIVAFFIQAAGFSICFFLVEPLFIYSVGAGTCALLFLLTWYAYRAAQTSRS